MLHHLGLGVSYKRVLSITTVIANIMCDTFESGEVVFPTNLNQGYFTIGAVDNIDHNPSATTSKDSFHGTSISSMQPRNTSLESAYHPTIPNESSKKSDQIATLPVFYTDVRPLALPSIEIFLSSPRMEEEQSIRPEASDKKKEKEWLASCKTNDSNDVSPNALSWSAYHASKHNENRQV